MSGDEQLGDLVEEANSGSTIENARRSIQTWRDGLGVSVGAALAIDAAFIAAGVYALQFQSMTATALGFIGIGIGGIGIVEKVARRVLP